MRPNVVIYSLPNSREVRDDGEPVHSTPSEALIVASQLQRDGFNATIVDLALGASRESDPYIKLAELLESAAGIHCITGLTCVSPQLVDSLALQSANDQKRVGLLGLAPIGCEQVILEHMSSIDFVISGNDASALSAYIRRSFLSGGSCRGIDSLAYREGNAIVSNPRSWNTFPSAIPQDFRLVDINQYLVVTMFASGGCPFGCTFCKRPLLYGKKVRYREIGTLEHEIQYLANSWRRSDEGLLWFQDDNFCLDSVHAERVCDLLSEVGRGLRWGCFMRVDLTNPGILRKLASSNCVTAFFGLESGSDAVLKEMKKGFTVREAKHAIELAVECLPEVQASFIWGYPGETLEQFFETVDLVMWAAKAGVKVKGVCPLLLYPGTTCFSNQIDSLAQSQLVNVVSTSLEPKRATCEKRIKKSAELFSPYLWPDDELFLTKAQHIDTLRKWLQQQSFTWRFPSSFCVADGSNPDSEP